MRIVTVRCELAGRIEDDACAIETGRWPYLWITENVRCDEPACPVCADDHPERFDQEPI